MLFPQRSIKVLYITLDAICIAHLYRQLYPQSFRIPGARPGTTKAKLIHDVAMEHDEEIFAKLFRMPKIQSKRKTHHFRYSLQTDGYSVALSFGRWVQSAPKPKTDKSRTKKRKTKQSSSATTKSVTELQPGYAYSYQNKTLNSLDQLKGITFRAVDPGVLNTYISVDLLTDDPDVRSSKKTLKSSTWQVRTKAKKHGDKVDKWRNAKLGEVQKRLNTTPYRTSASAKRYGKYVDNVFQHWDALWAFATQPKVRKERFRAYINKQRALDRVVNELCKPRPGDSKVLLVFGNAASTNLFGKTKNNVKGPARKIFNTVVRQKKAVCIWADEFRTSKLRH